MQRFRVITLLAALGITGAAVQADAPHRVVSINLCTDQLALDLAAPGQLVSVSKLAHDPQSSARVEQALALPTNGSGAEEVYLLNPDLVLAGTFTDPATVAMLRDLGIPVVLFAPAQSLADVPDRIAQMGAALGREDAAAQMIAAISTPSLPLCAMRLAHRPRAALYYVNSYTSGDKSLAGDILSTAGFENAAAQAGISTIGTLPLEQLILLAPDIIIQGRDYPGQSRAEDNFNHPALRALTGTVMAGELTDRDWICGTPQVLNAIRAMRDLRAAMGDTQ